MQQQVLPETDPLTALYIMKRMLKEVAVLIYIRNYIMAENTKEELKSITGTRYRNQLVKFGAWVIRTIPQGDRPGEVLSSSGHADPSGFLGSLSAHGIGDHGFVGPVFSWTFPIASKCDPSKL